MKLCECGCGKPVTKPKNRFIHGHNVRNINPKGELWVVEEERELAFLFREGLNDKEISEKKKIYRSPESVGIRRRRLGLWVGRGSKTKMLWRDSEYSKSMSIAHRGIPNPNKGKKGLRKHSEKTIKEMKETRMGHPHYGPKKHSAQTKRKISLESTRKWKNNQAFVSRQKEGRKAKPNKPERKLSSILEGISPEWEYVGDFSLVIGGKCPDFSNGGSKLVEFFGDYWHKGQDPQERIDLFRKYGYDCLVIWEHELKGETELKQKITEWLK